MCKWLTSSKSIKLTPPFCSAALALALTIQLTISPAFALSPALKQGMEEYNQGEYKAAEGHLGQALASDFDNAVLHYYLANTYVHLNKKQDAIKEFRIAYALEPNKEVGKLSKVALGYLGVEEGESEKKEKEKEIPKTPPKPSNPHLDRAVSTLNDEVKRERERSLRTAGELASDAKSRSSTILGNKKQDILDGLKYYRRGTQHQLPIPPEVLQQLDGLRGIYDQQSQGHIDSANRRSAELQKTADNLQSLMSDKNAKAGAKLSPVGTNLYIRNYQDESRAKTPASQTTSAGNSATPQASIKPGTTGASTSATKAAGSAK
ncbi:MAG: hypothetical protein IPP57_24740 [Candidatus Obscuribacter sp.]|nr:hypothetical protein [Candidatus Obscuribacter sp.]MDQ5966174.1 hypothetical protein [Cyanobacteriota bacterium erpe_2018_sw_39hr_WHONDRS-SW48-000098_B_bin.30]MBK9621933.1 hypothetical protein [Candidatus Obscuribacter sp.]MBK9773987.1 hypothetical protein [Candidatus Obscuribacter sp.]MBL0185697.1 hypothetical protein [Candidatus Obscuribacter sp.]